MIYFKLLLFNIMCDNDTINWDTKTLSVKSNIDYLFLNLTYFPDQLYKSKPKINSYLTKNPEIIYNWKKFISYWNDTIQDYNKVFGIEFDKLILNTDYILAPIYITQTDVYIGIILLNTNYSKKLIAEYALKNITSSSYNFLSNIKPYQYKNKININKYNFIYGILNKSFNTNTNKEFVLDIHKKISLNYILQNSMNYLPKLEIIVIKKNFQNLLNP